MKLNNSLLYTLSTFLLLSVNPTELFAAKNPAKNPSRKPSSVKPKISSAQKLKNLQAKLEAKSKDLDAKSKDLDAKNAELEKLKKDVADLKAAQSSNDKISELTQSIKDENHQISDLVKAIQDGKADIANLREEVKKSQALPQVKVEDKKPEAIVDNCHAKQQSAKLVEEVKSEIKDVNKVIEKVEEKVVVNNDKKDDKKDEDKVEAKSQKAVAIDNSDTINLMAQMTSMFSAQMQAQMQMQLQMMSMLAQMQSSMMPQQNSLLSPPSMPWALNSYPGFGSYGGFPSFNDQIGISSQVSPWSDYQNPYTLMPLKRQQVLQSPLGATQAPAVAPINGFDFNAAPATSENPAFTRNII